MSPEITITEYAGIPRSNEPLTFGVPCPKGKLFSGDVLWAHFEHGHEIPVQWQTTAYWPDGSVKWALVDMQVSLAAKSQLQFKLQVKSRKDTSNGILVSERDAGYTVDTNAAFFVIDKKMLKPFGKVVIGGTDLIDPADCGAHLLTESGVCCPAEIRQTQWIVRGPLRATLQLQGVFLHKRKSFADFTSYLTFFKDLATVKMEFTICNPRAARHKGGFWDLGDQGSIYFQELSVHTGLPALNDTLRWSSEPENTKMHAGEPPFEIYQDSSGGQNWQSSNHVNRFGEIKQRFRGYEVRSAGTRIAHGLRASPIVTAGHKGQRISVAVYQFWQNFPKALKVENNRLTVGLFPNNFDDVFELQGGEQKTHTIYFDFGGDADDLRWIHHPLNPVLNRRWTAKTGAIPYFSASFENEDKEYRQLIQAAVSGENSFKAKREIIDEYGWRNFGEVYADHEAVHNESPEPLVSHYNNQYDLIFGLLLQYMKTGQRAWFELTDDLARHVSDIDIYHTTRDREEYNGGLFWHTAHYLDAGLSTHRTFSRKQNENNKQSSWGGGPALEHAYTTGLLYHYYLTGNLSSRDSVLGIANWVKVLIDGPLTFCGKVHAMIKSRQAQPTVRYKNAYPFTRGSGNAISVLLDALQLTSDGAYLESAEKVIAGAMSPDDDIEARNLLDAERSWSYTVLLQAVGKYLDLKLERNQIDVSFHLARQSLLHYAIWMLENEYPYLDKPEILEFPTETWVAQELRKTGVFYYAAKYGPDNLKSRFVEKANFFFQYAMLTLRNYKTRDCARSITLLLQNGQMPCYCQGRQVRVQTVDSVGASEKANIEVPAFPLSFKQLLFEFPALMATTSLHKEIDWLKFRIQSVI